MNENRKINLRIVSNDFSKGGNNVCQMNLCDKAIFTKGNRPDRPIPAVGGWHGIWPQEVIALPHFPDVTNCLCGEVPVRVVTCDPSSTLLRVYFIRDLSQLKVLTFEFGGWLDRRHLVSTLVQLRRIKWI